MTVPKYAAEPHLSLAPLTHTLATMAGVLLKQDGTHEFVSFDVNNIMSCAEAYKARAVSSGDLDLVDVLAVEQDDGSIEFTCCIYDTAAGTLVSGGTVHVNQHFASFGTCIGDVLMYKTTAKQSCFEDMADTVLPSIGMNVGQCVSVVQKFSEKLRKFVGELKCEMAPVCRSLFPFLMRVNVDGKFAYYESHGTNIRLGSVEIDLLTFKPKRRRLAAVATSLSCLFDAVIGKRNVKRFCVVCKEPTRFCCSRCKGYYSCGSKACRKKAWKLHKESCVAK